LINQFVVPGKKQIIVVAPPEEATINNIYEVFGKGFGETFSTEKRFPRKFLF